MNTIWKFPIEITDEQRIPLTEGAEILCVQVQNGQPCLWVKMDPKTPDRNRKIFVHGTGHEVDAAAQVYIGTFQMNSGSLVFHVFTTH